MCDSSQPDEFLEIPRDELWAVVADDLWLRQRVPLQRALHNRLDVALRHRFPDLPVHDESAVPVEHAGQIVEGTADVDIRDVYVPVLMRAERLYEAGPLLRRRESLAVEPAGLLEHAIH